MYTNTNVNMWAVVYWMTRDRKSVCVCVCVCVMSHTVYTCQPASSPVVYLAAVLSVGPARRTQPLASSAAGLLHSVTLCTRKTHHHILNHTCSYSYVLLVHINQFQIYYIILYSQPGLFCPVLSLMLDRIFILIGITVATLTTDKDKQNRHQQLQQEVLNDISLPFHQKHTRLVP